MEKLTLLTSEEHASTRLDAFLADQLEATFSPVCRVVKVATVQEAVAAAHKVAERGDVVLFSPGTSSFDQFTGYVQRGQCFRDSVKQLLQL